MRKTEIRADRKTDKFRLGCDIVTKDNDRAESYVLLRLLLPLLTSSLPWMFSTLQLPFCT